MIDFIWTLGLLALWAFTGKDFAEEALQSCSPEYLRRNPAYHFGVVVIGGPVAWYRQVASMIGK